MFPLWAAYIAALFNKSRFIYCRHTRIGKSNKSIIKRIFQIIDIFIMRKADKVIVHGPYLKELALEFGVMSDRLIEFNWSFRNMPEIQNFKFKSHTKYMFKRIILFIGRLEAYKGIFDLLSACDEILKSDHQYFV